MSRFKKAGRVSESFDQFLLERELFEKQSEHTTKFHNKYPNFKADGKGRDAFTKAVASATGIKQSILNKVYDRGIGAGKSTGTRASVNSLEQWAKARVYSFATKASGTWGQADADLAKQVPKEVADKL
jgi:hypothetical protein